MNKNQERYWLNRLGTQEPLVHGRLSEFGSAREYPVVAKSKMNNYKARLLWISNHEQLGFCTLTDVRYGQNQNSFTLVVDTNRGTPLHTIYEIYCYTARALGRGDQMLKDKKASVRSIDGHFSTN